MHNQKAFTLIELLVVVLIIGILSAVALPQYQKAVEKSRAMQGLTMLKSMYASVESYKLANNTYPTSFEQLDLQLPWTGNVNITGTDSRSNEDWSIALYANTHYEGLIITRLSGPYVGGQFAIWDKHQDTHVPLHTITCNENLTGGTYVVSTEGLFCKKLFNGKYIIGGSGGRVYTFQE